MKAIALVLLLVTTNSFGQETSQSKKESGVEKIVKSKKKDRKKKVQMCHECGKPEEQCDCKGEEHRQGEDNH